MRTRASTLRAGFSEMHAEHHQKHLSAFVGGWVIVNMSRVLHLPLVRQFELFFLVWWSKSM